MYFLDLENSEIQEITNWNGLRTIFMSFDVDWAPDFMIQNILDILDEFNASATLFATHESGLLQDLEANSRHEIGIHPNLQPNSSQGQTYHEVLDRLKSWYPKAIGNRFHVLGYSYRDLMNLPKYGLRYDVSCLSYRTPYLLPSENDSLRLITMPYIWEDGVAENMGHALTIDTMELESPGLKILNFHPMNVYINGQRPKARLEFLQAVGPLLQCPEETAKTYRKEGEQGAGNALRDVLILAQKRNVQVLPVGSVLQSMTYSKGKS